MTTTRRLTVVQKDVLARLADGWRLFAHWGAHELSKDGEPSRHVRDVTVASLRDRRLIQWIPPSEWVLW